MMWVMEDTFDKLFWWKTPIPKINGAQKTKHMFNHCLTQYLKDLCLDFVLFKDPPMTQKQLSERNCNINACLQKYIGLFCFQSSHNLHNFTHTCWKLDMWEFKTGHSDSDLISCNVICRAWHVISIFILVGRGGWVCSLINACSQQSFVQVRDLKPLVLRI
jgi:hypothetical protein